MGFIKEFKQFVIKGNVMDLAVGIIIGAAFGKIVDSIVNDLIMPIAGLLLGEKGFKDSYLIIGGASKWKQGMSLEAARQAGVNMMAWGNFLTVVLNFIILAFVVFLLVKAISSVRKKEQQAVAAPPAPSTTEKLLMEIRDELKK